VTFYSFAFACLTKWHDFSYDREVPVELVREARGSEVHLNMEDHRHEDYVPLKPKVKAFSGKGHVLGRYDISPTAAIVTLW
jgi:UBX domain-containing protein 1